MSKELTSSAICLASGTILAFNLKYIESWHTGIMMETQGNDLLGIIKQRMAYLNQRQAVLAENVANSDTPGYKARDLVAPSFQDALKKVGNTGLTTTQPNHIVPAGMAGVNSKSVKVDTGEGRLNGNNVNLEQEMLKVSQTGIEYQQMTALYKKITGLFHIALKGQQ